MRRQSAQVTRPLTRDHARKELLILACAVDRVAWTEIGRSRSSRKKSNPLTSDLLGTLEMVSHFLPWQFGRWVRGASFLAHIGRMLGWLG